MQKILLKLRYYLEMIALPVFAYLVFHLAGHGTALLTGIHELEIIAGGLFLIFFAWLWHRPQLKKWVPCSHDHCHSELPIPHILATVALCLHFFPESGVRHELLRGVLEGEAMYGLGYIGFAAHAFIDLIIVLVLSSYWKAWPGKIISFIVMISVWVMAFFTMEHVHTHSDGASLEGWIFLVSAFLLAMFVHKPHKPKTCRSCEH